MAEWWPFDRSRAAEWKRSLTGVLAMSSDAATSLGLPQPGAVVGAHLAVLLDTARARLLGRKRTFSFYGRDLTLILEHVSVEGPDLAKAVGQYGQVRIGARNVEWDGYRLERIDIQARNVHLRLGAKPTLVAAPVLWEAFVSAAVASRWLASMSRHLELATHAGVPQIGIRGMPWACLEVEAGADGQCIRIRPCALRLLDWRVSLPAPAFHMSLPALPFEVTLTSVEAAPGGFVIRGVLAEWQRSLSRADVERLLAMMRSEKDHPGT
jgi:LmeA-like phospholipid-binding